jgi:hypothetical protein
VTWIRWNRLSRRSPIRRNARITPTDEPTAGCNSMKSPDAQALLQAWEVSQGAHMIRRGLMLLAAAWPERDVQAWARLTIGERDARLLNLRELLFGRDLQTTTSCPACGERLESSFTTDDIRVPIADSSASLIRWREEGCEIEYRLPTSEDLLAVCEGRQDSGSAPAILLRRCVAAARQGQTALDPADLPSTVVVRLSTDMQQHDPGADVRIGLSCPACFHEWTTCFDIVSYLWDEIEDWAGRLLADVHVLAQAYGWNERDILALSSVRRQLYLDMVRA